jgi:hypothetical protein
MTNRTHQQRQKVVKTKRTSDALVKKAQQANEQGLHQRDPDAVVRQQNPSSQAGQRIQQRIHGPQSQHGIQLTLSRFPIHQIDKQIANAEAKPANPNGHGLRLQFTTRRVQCRHARKAQQTLKNGSSTRKAAGTVVVSVVGVHVRRML